LFELKIPEADLHFDEAQKIQKSEKLNHLFIKIKNIDILVNTNHVNILKSKT
jgi:hypothetical protein